MIYWDLFITFLQIGAFSFGGGYGMISLIREKMLQYGWITEETLLNMIAVAESTPGPIAVNMATFIGSSQGGIPGAILATLGVVLPSFIVILLIAAALRNLLQYPGVKAFLGGVRPCVVGLILGTAFTLLLRAVATIGAIGDAVRLDWRALLIFCAMPAISGVWKKHRGKKPSPIFMILIAAALGMLLYAL